MKWAVVIWLAVVCAGAAVNSATGQTCSCAGAPLISAQSTGATSAGNFLFGITYEYHEIASIYTGGRRLQDDSVTRNTQSLLMEANYGITDRLSLSATLAYVRKDRTTGIGPVRTPTSALTQGVGDGLVVARYVVSRQSLWNRYHLSLGGGLKIPFGTSSITRNGLQMNADMQPGTGAWDGVVTSYASVSLLPFSTLGIFSSNSFRLTGTNERFGQDDRYTFGNELVSAIGAGDGVTSRLSYELVLQYRSTSSDRLNGNTLPNTGGRWLSVVPAVNLAMTDVISVRFSGRLPVLQHVSGTQPTTSFAVSASLFINLNSLDNGFAREDTDRTR